MRPKIRLPLLSVFAAMAVVLTASGVSIFLMGSTVVRSNRLVDEHRRQIADLESCLSTLKDVETGERGYLLTGDEPYLEPYNQGVRKIHDRLAALQKWVRSGDLPGNEVDEIARLANEKLAELDQVITLRREKGFDAAVALVRTNRGKQTMDQARTLIGNMVAHETHHLEAAERAAEQATMLRTLVFIVCGIVNLAFLIWAYQRLHRVMVERETAAAETQRQAQDVKDHEEELAAIYDNAPLVMMLVDGARHVRKANRFAEQFTGASAMDLLGRRAGEALSCLHALDDPRGCGFGPHCQDCTIRRTVMDTFETGTSHQQVEAERLLTVGEQTRQLTFSLSTARLNIRGEQQVLVTLQDITERKHFEAANAWLATFPRFNPGPIVEVDLEGKVYFINPAAEHLFPGLAQSPLSHAWLGDWQAATAACRQEVAKGVVREIAVGERWYQQLLYWVPSAQRIRTYGIDVTERKKAEESLRQTAEELGRSNRDLEQFAYVASHDLQEPLRMVTGFMQLFEQKYRAKLDDQADKYIAYAVDGSKRMQLLIDDLLTYARVGRRGRELAPTDTGKALEVALANLRTAIDDSGAQVTHGALPTVRGDSIQLTQVFQNLVGNALKFRGPGAPRIHIEARREAQEWVFSVADNGIGIEPQYFQRVFEVFQRLHGRSEYPGTGIGLAICKKIVERHAGRIWVESELGKGSTFRFSVPAQGA